MNTGFNRRDRSRDLRKSGLSIKQISKMLGAAQSSVSIWTKDIVLTQEQKAALAMNTHTREVIEKRRASRLKSEAEKRAIITSLASDEIELLSEYEMKLICTALYWAEGAKKRGAVQFTNGDPRMIRLMLRFFRDVCHVEESKLRAYIHIHEHLDTMQAEAYWQNVTGIASGQFYKTYCKPNKSSMGTRRSLPYGVCDIYVMDTKLFLKIQGWTDGIYRNAKC